MFSFADALLLRPLPVRDPDRVVAIDARTATSAPVAVNTALSFPDYADFRDRNRSFEGLVAASTATLGFSPRAGMLPRVKLGQFVSSNFFRVLGVEPALGRGFRADEDQAEGRDPVAVLSHDFWVSQFGASPSVLGSRIRLNGIELTVIGVAPAAFTGIEGRPAVYLPLAMAPRLGQNDLHRRDVAWLSVRGRLRPGVSLEQARADIGMIAAGIEKLHPQSEGARRILVQTEFQLRVEQSPPTAAMVIMLGLLALAVLAAEPGPGALAGDRGAPGDRRQPRRARPAAPAGESGGGGCRGAGGHRGSGCGRRVLRQHSISQRFRVVDHHDRRHPGLALHAAGFGG
jgi:hypothetical protein